MVTSLCSAHKSNIHLWMFAHSSYIQNRTAQGRKIILIKVLEGSLYQLSMLLFIKQRFPVDFGFWGMISRNFQSWVNEI